MAKRNLWVSVGLSVIMLLMAVISPVVASATTAADFEAQVLTQEEMERINSELDISNKDSSTVDAISGKVQAALSMNTYRSSVDSGYAGHYIDENGRVHLFWAGADNRGVSYPKENVITSLKNENIDVVITPVEYSMAEIDSVLASIDNVFLGSSSIPYGIRAYY